MIPPSPTEKSRKKVPLDALGTKGTEIDEKSRRKVMRVSAIDAKNPGTAPSISTPPPSLAPSKMQLKTPGYVLLAPGMGAGVALGAAEVGAAELAELGAADVGEAAVDEDSVLEALLELSGAPVTVVVGPKNVVVVPKMVVAEPVIVVKMVLPWP